MIFGFGKKKHEVVDEEPTFDPVRFLGALNGKQAVLAANSKLVQAGLNPAKELVSTALFRRAETVRMEPKGEAFIAGYLVDGVAYPGMKFPKPVGNAIVQMLKLLAGLDIKVRNQQQSGGIKAEFDERPYELGIEATPVAGGGGERLIIRSRDLKKPLDKPEEIGITEDFKNKIRALTAGHKGALLVCGPPLSGTTTTMFGVLRSLDAYTHSIYNIADTGSRDVPYATKFEVNAGDDLATTLDRVRRVEAEIVFTNPIADAKSAAAVLAKAEHMAILAEFRAKDAATGICQLVEWAKSAGGSPGLVADNLKAVISTRLIRLLCEGCREAYRPNPKLIEKVGLPRGTSVLYRPLSREAIAARMQEGEEVPCAETGGYQGRAPMFELIEVTDEMRKLIAAGPTPDQLKAQARKEGMPTFQKDGLRLVAAGKTSLEELQRIFKG